MTHTKFTIISIIICGLSNLIEQLLSLIIFTNPQISALFNGNLNNAPLLAAFFIKILLSGLIGGILGFILFPLFYPAEKLKVDFSNNSLTKQDGNANDKSTKEEISPAIPIEQQDVQHMKPDEAAKHLENTETKKEFDEKLSNGTFEDPNVVVENPGQKLVDNPATLFDPPPNEVEKPQLDEESFGKKRYELGTPKP